MCFAALPSLKVVAWISPFRLAILLRAFLTNLAKSNCISGDAILRLLYDRGILLLELGVVL